ncbi:MAG: hypothetical protein HUU20_05715 [Pirellulales bacterium]|nr:hypothetical protein [Pirellulales bacterium]
MAASSRSAQYNHLAKVLKKHYKPVLPAPDRPVLETLLFGCCLENARYEAAEEAFAALVHNFFDFNEVRVSSVRELSEAIPRLPDPAAAATRVKRILQEVFEATYSFDLEDIRKQNLGPAVERLEKLGGTTKFSVAYVVQATLGGHAIAIDSGTLQALYVADLVSDEDVGAGIVPGLERAIPKNKGGEFGSMLHQLGADFTANPYAPALHEILLEINPDAKSRLPKRRAAKAAEPATDLKRAPGKSEAAAVASEGQTVSGEPATPPGSQRKRKADAEKPEKLEKPAKSPKKKGVETPPPDGVEPAAPVEPAPPAGSQKKKTAASKPPAARKGPKEPSLAEPAEKEAGVSGLPKRKPR